MPKTDHPFLIYGPAYLDVVLRVDRPLAETPIDIGCDGFLEPGAHEGLEVVCPGGASLAVSGAISQTLRGMRLRASHDVLPERHSEAAIALETVEDLGGMGAGYAAALGGHLVSALAEEGDRISQAVRRLIENAGIDHSAVIVPGQPQADSTLILTSGRYGDKLPIGLRGCHAGLKLESAVQATLGEVVVVVASLANSLMGALLNQHTGAIRILAPSARNCRDRAEPLGMLANVVDLLAMNEAEWAALRPEDRQAFETSSAILSVTRGPEGAEISWRGPDGLRHRHTEPALPRGRPPVDTNRAGEAFASQLIRSLRASGWTAGRCELLEDTIRRAARHASAAAAIVIDMPGFGFPSPAEVDEAVRRGSIP